VEKLETPAWGSKPYDDALAKQDEPDFRAKIGDEIMLQKGLMGLGAIRNTDRPEALDLLGFASQLVFTTAYLGTLLIFDLRDGPELQGERPAAGARLQRWRQELHVGVVPRHSVCAHADTGHDDHRRRAGAVPRSTDRPDRVGRQLGARLDAVAGLGGRGLPEERGSFAEDVVDAERADPPAGPGDAVSPRGRRMDRAGMRAGDGHVLVRLPPSRGRPQPDQAVREQPWRGGVQ